MRKISDGLTVDQRYYRNKRKPRLQNDVEYRKKCYLWHNEYYKKYRLQPNEKERLERIRYGMSRKEILERFDNRCAICGISKDLCVHHKDGNGLKLNGSIKETINNAVDNLIVVCRKCHFKHHVRQEIAI